MSQGVCIRRALGRPETLPKLPPNYDVIAFISSRVFLPSVGLRLDYRSFPPHPNPLVLTTDTAGPVDYTKLPVSDSSSSSDSPYQHSVAVPPGLYQPRTVPSTAPLDQRISVGQCHEIVAKDAAHDQETTLENPFATHGSDSLRSLTYTVSTSSKLPHSVNSARDTS